MDAARLVDSREGIGRPDAAIDKDGLLVLEDRKREVLKALDRARDLVLGLAVGKTSHGVVEHGDDVLEVSDDSTSHCLSSAVKLLMAYDAEGPYGVLNSSCGAAIVMLWAWKLTGDEDYRKCAKDTMLGCIYGDKIPSDQKRS